MFGVPWALRGLENDDAGRRRRGDDDDGADDDDEIRKRMEDKEGEDRRERERERERERAILELCSGRRALELRTFVLHAPRPCSAPPQPRGRAQSARGAHHHAEEGAPAT